MQFGNQNYYSAMDDLNGSNTLPALKPAEVDDEGEYITPDEALNFTIKDIGTTTNPMTGQIQALQEKIKHGAGRIEFSFLGAGKGNAQRPTPESFGHKERQDIRELLNINEMKTSTHAAVHMESLAGFTKEGFNSEARANVLKEIKRAIHFAGEATKGGAIVFHTNEWQRPMSEIKDTMGNGFKFEGHLTENKDAVLIAVDARTGRSFGALSKDQEIFRPKYKTADSEKLVGKKDPAGNGVFQSGDFVDINGNRIERESTDIHKLFNRVPIFNKEFTNFEVDKLGYKEVVEETNRYNEGKAEKDQRTPEEMAAILQLENQVLQYKGNSLYHARTYVDEERSLKRLKNSLDLYDKMTDGVPENEKNKWRNIAEQYGTIPDGLDPREFLQERIKFMQNSLKHIHESSASADVMATEAQQKIQNVQSAEKYGLQKTAETIALSGMEAMQVYNKNKNKYGLTEEIYVAPENWDPKMYGSHPDEYRKIIQKSRATMAEMLKRKGESPEKAKELAKTHIKGTLDIGHMNLFRSYFKGSDKDFEKWMLTQAESLVKEGYVGHIHLSDNFGYDDEHLTPGQGNVPMKEFLKKLEEHGMKDIIVEQGSFNPLASLETLGLVNSPIYGASRATRFNNVYQQHFGTNAPGFFIAGSYVPSNDWRPWSEIPLE